MIVEACAVRSKVYALKIKNNGAPEEKVSNSPVEKTEKEQDIDTKDKWEENEDEDEWKETENEDEFEEMKRLKGIKKLIVKKRLTIRDYKKTLYGKRPMTVSFSKIASKKHNVTTNFVKKRALSAFDDKRWMLPCRIHSFPYNSIEIENFKGQCPFCSKEV